MKILLKIIVISFFLLTSNFVAQTESGKWNLGLSGSLVGFGPESFTKIRDRVNGQMPIFQVSKNLSDKLSIDFLLTYPLTEFPEGFNQFEYTSFDTYLRYNLPELFLGIQPFGGIGIGFIDGATTTPDPQTSISLNIMGGATLWLSDRFGLTGRLVYKHISADSVSMAPHVQAIGGIVYVIGSSLSSSSSGRRRIWDMRH